MPKKKKVISRKLFKFVVLVNFEVKLTQIVLFYINLNQIESNYNVSSCGFIGRQTDSLNGRLFIVPTCLLYNILMLLFFIYKVFKKWLFLHLSMQTLRRFQRATMLSRVSYTLVKNNHFKVTISSYPTSSTCRRLDMKSLPFKLSFRFVSNFDLLISVQ